MNTKKVAVAVLGAIGILAPVVIIAWWLGRYVQPLWLASLLSGGQGFIFGRYGSKIVFNYLLKE